MSDPQPTRSIGQALSDHKIGIAAALTILLFWGFAAAWWMAENQVGPSEPVSAAKLEQLQRAAASAGCTLASDKGEGLNDHTDGDVTYPTVPAMSGQHATEPASDGDYRARPRPRDEALVHSQEHGRIVLHFKDAAGAAGQVFDADRKQMLIVKTPQITGKVAASTWGRSIVCAENGVAQAKALELFRDTYRGRGPERVA